MRRNVFMYVAAISFGAAYVGGPSLLEAQGIDWKGRLQAQLESAYRLTKVASFEAADVRDFQEDLP